MTEPKFTIRALIARERLFERLALNAGVNPHSGISPVCEALTLADETEADRKDRLTYRQTFHDQAVSEIAGLMDESHLRVWRAMGDGSMSRAEPIWAGNAFFEGPQSGESLYLDREEWERALASRHPLTDLGKMTQAALSGALNQNLGMQDIDPIDGLPLDLDAELERLAKEREREAAEDAEAEAHLRAGDWMSTAEALSLLMERGSLREEAIGSLRMWLVSNDGQRPYLRARADHAIREYKGPHFKPSEVKRDRIIHGWEWDAEFLLADWGTGTFRLREAGDDLSAFVWELRLVGVTLSRDDLDRRLGVKSERLEDASVSEVERADQKACFEPASDAPKRGRPKGLGFRITDVPALEAMHKKIQAGALLTTAAKEVESELFKQSSETHWERWRKAYPRWRSSLDN